MASSARGIPAGVQSYDHDLAGAAGSLGFVDLFSRAVYREHAEREKRSACRCREVARNGDHAAGGMLESRVVVDDQPGMPGPRLKTHRRAWSHDLDGHSATRSDKWSSGMSSSSAYIDPNTAVPEINMAGRKCCKITRFAQTRAMQTDVQEVVDAYHAVPARRPGAFAPGLQSWPDPASYARRLQAPAPE